jgi:hypothetical protein
MRDGMIHRLAVASVFCHLFDTFRHFRKYNSLSTKGTIRRRRLKSKIVEFAFSHYSADQGYRSSCLLMPTT